MKHLVFILTALFTLVSCHNRQEASLSDADSAAVDSTLIRVAVMPALSCLPVYYASETGLMDSLGFHMELVRYNAALDIDTAIVRGHADIAFSDLIRAIRLTEDVDLTPLASCPENLSLIVQKSTRVKRMRNMKERMVAITRLSATDYWCDRLIDTTKTKYDDLYRPQVNDVTLRTDMLRTDLIDAAILGEPFASWMTMLGHRRLAESETQSPTLLSWVTTVDSIRSGAFLEMIRLSTDKINNGEGSDAVHRILQNEFRLPAEACDSLRLPALPVPTAVTEQDITAAQQWLTHRKRLPGQFNINRFQHKEGQP